MLQQLIAREIEKQARVAARMKLAIIPGFNVLVPQGKLVGGTLQDDAAVQPRRRDRLRDQLEQLPREERPAARRDVRLCRPARNDGRLRQSGAARARATGCRSTAIGSRARPCRCPAARSAGRPKARRRRPICAPKAWSRRKCVNDGQRGYLSIRTNARARTTSAPTRSAARSALLGMFLPGWGMHLADMAVAAGRPDPRGRATISARSRTVARRVRPSAAASLSASVADGVNTPFSTVLTVLRVTPTARRARPGSGRARCAVPSTGWRAVQPSRVRAPFQHAEADQGGGDADATG